MTNLLAITLKETKAYFSTPSAYIVGAMFLVLTGVFFVFDVSKPFAEAGVRGLICLGYPFHPTSRPDKLRIDHLRRLQTPSLFLQGDRDRLGHIDNVANYRLSHNIRLKWLEDGDHGFKPRKKSGRTEKQNWKDALDALICFTKNLQASKHGQ